MTVSQPLAIDPVLLGPGAHLLGGLELRAIGCGVNDVDVGAAVMHVLLRR